MSEEIVKADETNEELARALEGLSAGEALAMQCIMRGETMTAAAQAANVSRTALYKWLEPGKPLYEAMTVWKQDMATTARTRLLMMSEMATENIFEALAGGDAKIAMKLMEKLGILSPPPVGPTRAEMVTAEVTTKQVEREMSVSLRTRAADFVNGWTEMRRRKPKLENEKSEANHNPE
jgi:hypothetical protein